MNIFTSRDSLESKLKLLMLLRLVNKNCAQFEFKKLLILLQSSNSCLQCGFGSTSKKLWQMLVLLLFPTLTKINNPVQRTHVNTRLQRDQTILLRLFFQLNTKNFHGPLMQSLYQTKTLSRKKSTEQMYPCMTQATLPGSSTPNAVYTVCANKRLKIRLHSCKWTEYT